jgi:hypothetical protein
MTTSSTPQHTIAATGRQVYPVGPMIVIPPFVVPLVRELPRPPEAGAARRERW